MRLTVLGLLTILVAATPPGKVAVDHDDEATHFFVEGELVASYHHGRDIDKPYIWPLLAPGHVPVTRGSPNHISAWIGHGEVVVEGIAVAPSHKDSKGTDFWSHQPGHGVITCSSVTTVNQPGRAELRSANVWRTNDRRAILDEERKIELYNLDTGRLLLVTSTLKSAGLPVTFGDTSSGFLALRVNDQLRIDRRENSLKSKNQITDAAGRIGEANCWGQHADWCDHSGEVDGQLVGVTIFDDPANKPRACWQVRDNGLLAANPFGRSEKAGYPVFKNSPEPLVRLKFGEQLTLHYGIFVHSGDVKSGDVAGAYRKFLALLQ